MKRQGKLVSNEQTPHTDDRDDDEAIEFKTPFGSLRIPARRSDIGPFIRYVLFAISGGIIISSGIVSWAIAKKLLEFFDNIH